MCVLSVCVMLAAAYDALCMLGVGVAVCYAYVFGLSLIRSLGSTRTRHFHDR